MSYGIFSFQIVLHFFEKSLQIKFSEVAKRCREREENLRAKREMKGHLYSKFQTHEADAWQYVLRKIHQVTCENASHFASLVLSNFSQPINVQSTNACELCLLLSWGTVCVKLVFVPSSSHLG